MTLAHETYNLTPFIAEIDTCLIEPDEHRLTFIDVSRILLYSDTKYLKSAHFKAI